MRNYEFDYNSNAQSFNFIGKYKIKELFLFNMVLLVSEAIIIIFFEFNLLILFLEIIVTLYLSFTFYTYTVEYVLNENIISKTIKYLLYEHKIIFNDVNQIVSEKKNNFYELSFNYSHPMVIYKTRNEKIFLDLKIKIKKHYKLLELDDLEKYKFDSNQISSNNKITHFNRALNFLTLLKEKERLRILIEKNIFIETHEEIYSKDLLEFRIERNDIKINVMTKKINSRRPIRTRRYITKIDIDTHIKIPVSFKFYHIRNNSKFKNKLEKENTEFNYVSCHNLYSIDIYKAKKILNNLDIKIELIKLLELANILSFSGERLSINLEMYKNFYSVNDSLDIIIKVIDKLEEACKEGILEKVIIGDNFYKCTNCNEIIALHGENCLFCGVKTPRCVICWSDPEPNDIVYKLLCCESYAHLNHLQKWIERKNICPSCKQKKPIYKEILVF